MKVKKSDKGSGIDRRIGRTQKRLNKERGIVCEVSGDGTKKCKQRVETNREARQRTNPKSRKDRKKGLKDFATSKKHNLRIVKSKKPKRTKEDKLEDKLTKLRDKAYKNKKRDHANPRFL